MSMKQIKEHGGSTTDALNSSMSPNVESGVVEDIRPTTQRPADKPQRYVVGTNLSGYPHRRNFLSLPLQKYEFKLTRERDVFALAQNRYVARLLRRYPHTRNVLAHLYYDFNASGSDLLHFFNSVSLGRTPWVTTFESIVPFWGWHSELMTRRALRALSGAHCRKLIAISNRTYDVQTQFFLSRYPEYRDDIIAKTCIIHPAQQVLVSDY